MKLNSNSRVYLVAIHPRVLVEIYFQLPQLRAASEGRQSGGKKLELESFVWAQIIGEFKWSSLLMSTENRAASSTSPSHSILQLRSDQLAFARKKLAKFQKTKISDRETSAPSSTLTLPTATTSPSTPTTVSICFLF